MTSALVLAFCAAGLCAQGMGGVPPAASRLCALSVSNKDFDAGMGTCVDGRSQCSGKGFDRPRRAAFFQKTFLSFPIGFAPVSQCQQTRLTDAPDWLTATFWVENNSYLGMLDTYRGEIYLLDARGRTIKTIMTEAPIEALARYQGRLLAKGRGNSFFFVTDDLKMTRDSFVLPGFGSLYTGWVVNGDEIVAYGSVPKRDSSSSSPAFDLGFMRLKPKSRAVEMVLPFKDNDFYLINYQYLATTNGDAYFIAMNHRAVIYRLPKGGRAYPLKAMPKEYSKIQVMSKNFRSADATKQRFQELENFRMPVGLYGYDGFIYLLGRNPESCSPWSLTKIDPIHDKEVGAIPLPTIARHITLVPSENAWLIIEKGAVTDRGQQKITAVESVPAAWITHPESSPLRARSRWRDCLSER